MVCSRVVRILLAIGLVTLLLPVTLAHAQSGSREEANLALISSVGMRAQAEIAANHASLGKASAHAGDLAGVALHACHIVNTIEGLEGANFDATCDNPGDGVGLLNYAKDTATHSNLALLAAPDEPTVIQFAPIVIEGANLVTNDANIALEAALWIEKNNFTILEATLYMNNAAISLGGGNAARYVGAVNQSESTYQDAQDWADANAALPSVGEPLIPQLARWALISGALLILISMAMHLRARALPRS